MSSREQAMVGIDGSFYVVDMPALDVRRALERGAGEFVLLPVRWLTQGEAVGTSVRKSAVSSVRPWVARGRP